MKFEANRPIMITTKREVCATLKVRLVALRK